jgi:dihydroorotase
MLLCVTRFRDCMHPTMTRLTLPQWYDLHAHMRQEQMLEPMIAAHLAMGCCGMLAMPNTKPPVAKVHEADPLPYWSIEGYLAQLREAGGTAMTDIIVPLYLTRDTTPAMIEAGAKSGLLRAAKYYPPHGTTGADHGYPFAEFLSNGVFEALADNGVVLCIHGEQHGLAAEAYFDRERNAESAFYGEQMPRLIDKLPSLKVVGEHITTETAAVFIESAPDTVAATVTPQHLLYTVGHLLKGCNYHLYCLPLVKYASDREALRAAVTMPGQRKFFAGTDSAPHTTKATACGCAAGCYTGGIAPQLYAEGFEAAYADLESEEGVETFTRFLCLNGPEFYGLKAAPGTFTLVREPQSVAVTEIPGGGTVMPLPLGLGHDSIGWRIETA